MINQEKCNSNIDELDFKLCYINGTAYGGFAYFTPSMESVHGDDWNDVPYWDNAGQPYSEEPLLCIAFIARGFMTPEDAYYLISVEGLNNRAYPWLQKSGDTDSEIYGGDSIKQFCAIMNKYKCEVFLPISSPTLFQHNNELKYT